MTRNIEDESKKIRNGNRYIDDPDGNGVFARDVDRLFNEYSNLRYKLYNKYRGNFSNEATREELMSYIDEQFITLVKEYKINNPVDFPGYVKRKLYARVSQNFVRRKKRDATREMISEEEDTIQDTLEEEKYTYIDLETEELIKFIFRGTNPSALERDILSMWFRDETDTQISRTLSKKYDIQSKEVRNTMKALREFVEVRLKEYNGY